MPAIAIRFAKLRDCLRRFHLRVGGHHAWGDLLDLVRFLVFFAWARLAWRCTHNVEQGFWTPVAKLALGGGVVCMAMI